jgi:predicted dehydrogenase
MIRIGIIGSDSSHADAFAQLINLPTAGEFAFPGFAVTAIFGLDKERTEEVAREGKIPFIAEKPEDMLDKVDAVMVVFRRGDLHLKYALPFIEAGKPAWIDKPFAISNEDAQALINAAKAHNTLLTGGSDCKYASDIITLKNMVVNGSRIGKVKTAMLNFPAELTNEYGGLCFYGAHLVEMTMEVFGYNPVSVIASEQNENVVAVVKYEDYQVVMNFIPGAEQYHAILFGTNGVLTREIDISMIYTAGIEKFTGMIKTGKLPLPLEHLYAPVKLLNAVVESFETKKEIKLN